MRVGWLVDDPGYVGGAELTMAEFRDAAPGGIEVIDCPPGGVVDGLDVYVLGNCRSYASEELPVADAWVYHHDLTPVPLPGKRIRHIYCSPLQRERMKGAGECIPPAIDLGAFHHYASQDHRHGSCCVGRMAYGKGLELLAEYPEPVDVYSSVPFITEGNARYQGKTADVAATLAQYQRFVFLPTALEPCGRSVLEAWAAGLDLVVNRNVGAIYWIEQEPEALRTASADFWELIVNG